ncbi:hypothetical protein J9317_12680 [Metabacillus sp. KIGAM252]|uniref:Uncharacterized protein n=1 Tax=Metabacillus flavus TaxID=2823519 RepID=A0ABS5LG91_9BACI|nr:hypothetical protein [Metabacillus flavus]MBS2969621.1 hypothetical protein [Metabacillus flavus]
MMHPPLPFYTRFFGMNAKVMDEDDIPACEMQILHIERGTKNGEQQEQEEGTHISDIGIFFDRSNCFSYFGIARSSLF